VGHWDGRWNELTPGGMGGVRHWPESLGQSENLKSKRPDSPIAQVDFGNF